MPGRVLAVLAMLHASVALAADVNTASAMELDGLKGVGPPMTRSILDERKKNGEFKSWDDLMARVKGIKQAKAAALSKEGLTVNGAAFTK